MTIWIGTIERFRSFGAKERRCFPFTEVKLWWTRSTNGWATICQKPSVVLVGKSTVTLLTPLIVVCGLSFRILVYLNLILRVFPGYSLGSSFVKSQLIPALPWNTLCLVRPISIAVSITETVTRVNTYVYIMICVIGKFFFQLSDWFPKPMIWAVIVKFDQIRKNWWRISCAEILEFRKNFFVTSSVKKMSGFKEVSPEQIKRIAWKFTKTVVLLGLAGYELI